MSYHFQATALDEGALDGEVEIRGSRWIFRTLPSTQQLQAQNIVHAGFWDTFFSVSVIVHCDMELTIPARHPHALRWIVWGAVLVLFMAALAVFFFAR
jgi:hypothetical protein